MDPKTKERLVRIRAIIEGKKAPNTKPVKVPNTKPVKVPGKRRHRYGKKSEKTSTRKEIQTKDDVKKDFLKYIDDKQPVSKESAEKLMDYIDKNWDAEDIRKAFGTIQLEGMGQLSSLDPTEDTKKAMKEFYLGPNEKHDGVRMAALMKLVRNMGAIKKNESSALKKQISNDGIKLFTKANAGEEITMVDNPMHNDKKKRATIGGKTRKRRRKKKKRTRKRRRTKKKRKRRRRKRRRTRKY
jgi:hypothetical protein